MLYVRQEARPGSTTPDHLFVVTRDRVVYERWHPVADPLPAALELRLDPDATERAARLADELTEANAKAAALGAALRRAVEVVPVEVGNELRSVYRETFGRLYGSRS
jgi:hypothetical protein